MSVRTVRYNTMNQHITKSAFASTDRDALAFLEAAQIYNTNQQRAIVNLVRSLKRVGLWTKMKAIYPFVGGTASAHKWNLKDPRDLDAAYRLTFSGGWTHSNTGADPNGTNAYANTYFIANGQLALYNGHLSYYARENITVTGTNQTVIGVGSNSVFWNSREAWFIEYTSVNTNYSQHSTAATTDRCYVTPTITMQGYSIGSRRTSDPTTLKFFKNTSLLSTASTSVSGQALNIYSVYIGAFNNRTASAPYASNYTSNECAFATIGEGLTDSDATNLYNIVQRYQSQLGRAIEPDAQAFINAAGITDTTQKEAILDLVVRLKNDGLWSKMKAIYPFIGGTSTTHKWNLKDPRDLDAAYRLTFSGGWTHSNTGADPNGTNAYANTFLTPSASLTYTNTHVSVYIRENIYSNIRHIEVGSYIGSPNRLVGMYTNYLNNLDIDIGDFNVSRVTVANTDSRGYYIATRTSNTLLRAYRNGSTVGSNTNNDTVGLPTNPITYSAVLVGTNYVQFSSKQIAFATIGEGLTDTEATNLYNIVDLYQRRLGRNV